METKNVTGFFIGIIAFAMVAAIVYPFVKRLYNKLTDKSDSIDI